MIVKELINKLLDCPMDALVLVSIPECKTVPVLLVETEVEGRVDDVRRRGTGDNEQVFIRVGF